MEREDPLLLLLRRYEAGLKHFNAPTAPEMDDEHWNRLAEETWHGAQQEIIRSRPAATTIMGALMALDHVLKSDELFAELSDSEEVQMLWQLIKSARDYLASLETPTN